MKKPDWKLGKAFTVLTAAYLVCSVFGCVLYLVLPPVLCSVGARVHAYLLFRAFRDSAEPVWPVFWMIAGHLYVLAMVAFGIRGLKTGKLKIFTLMTALDILLCMVILAVEGSVSYEYTSGILVNLAYCFWLFRKSLPPKFF